MNEYYIALRGKANIPEPLEIAHNFKIEADCSITGENKTDNENGTFSITWKAEPVTVTVTKDNGEVVKARDPRKNSQKIRNYLWKHYYDEGYGEDFEAVYNEFTMIVMRDTPIILREAIKRLKEKHE